MTSRCRQVLVVAHCVRCSQVTYVVVTWVAIYVVYLLRVVAVHHSKEYPVVQVLLAPVSDHPITVFSSTTRKSSSQFTRYPVQRTLSHFKCSLQRHNNPS